MHEDAVLQSTLQSKLPPHIVSHLPGNYGLDRHKNFSRFPGAIKKIVYCKGAYFHILGEEKVSVSPNCLAHATVFPNGYYGRSSQHFCLLRDGLQ